MENNGTANPTATQRAGLLAATDPMIWEYALSRELYEARAACLRGLSRIPTGLGKLAYLAILQNQLLEVHNELFGEWLGCSLQQKYEWLSCLLTSASCSGALPDEWLNGSVYSELVPRSAEKTERDLYRTEIDALLEILMNEIDHGQSEPVSDLGAEVPNWTTVR